MTERSEFVADLGQQLADAAPRVAARRRRSRRVVGGVIVLAMVAGGFAILHGVFSGDDSADVELVASPSEQSSEEVADAIDVLTGVEWAETTTSIGGEALPSVVWTGSEVLVLRTENGGNDVVGEMWDPASGGATRTADSGLNWRAGAAVAWTGDELLVVGGSNGPGLNQIGAAYDPTSDEWRPLSDPPGEIDAWENSLIGPGVWTGSEMIIWTAGLAYNPASDAWRTTALSPLSERARPTTVWTGTHLLVWGGCQQDGVQCDEANTGLLADGAAYDPLTDTWSMMPASPLPAAVHLVGGWTGTEAVFSVTEDGEGKAGATALYDPVTERWRIAQDSPLSPRRFAASVWAEDRFVVWGGGGGESDSGFSTGAVFDPAQDRWSPLPDSPGPGRSLHSMVDTGDGIYISATRTQSPPLVLRLPASSTEQAPMVQDRNVAAEPCVATPSREPGSGLIGLPVSELWPQGFEPGFEADEPAYAVVDDPAFETNWFAVAAVVRDLGDRPLGLGVWLMPDPIVAYTGPGEPDPSDPNPQSWQLYAYNAIARAASLWRPFEIEGLNADPQAIIADCFAELPEPFPFLSGQLLDGAEWILTEHPEHGLCLAESGLDYGCDDVGPVIGSDDPPETMRIAAAARPDPGISGDNAGDLAYGYLPDNATTIELLDAAGNAQPVEVVLDTETGMWAAPITPGNNPVAARYLDNDQQIITTVTR